MSNSMELLLIWWVGMVLGSFFFCGLWWTVQRSLRSKNTATWLLTSLLLRMTVTVFGFYLVATNEMSNPPWLRLLICMLGFICARLVISTVISRIDPKQTTHVDEPINQVSATEQLNSSEGSQHAP